MKSLHFFIILPVIAALFTGCGSSEQVQKESAPPAEEKEERVLLTQWERSFNPSDFDDEIAENRMHVVFEEQKAAGQQHDSVVVESEFSQGYRIQIYASGSIDEANAMRMTAAQHMTDDSLYVVFDPPVYKVRVGDYRTRAEASQRLGAIIGEGFSDAWVVGDRIVLRKLVRVQDEPPLQK